MLKYIGLLAFILKLMLMGVDSLHDLEQEAYGNVKWFVKVVKCLQARCK